MGVNNKSVTATNYKNDDDALVELVDLLSEIDTESELAKLNAISISDNKGGRIHF